MPREDKLEKWFKEGIDMETVSEKTQKPQEQNKVVAVTVTFNRVSTLENTLKALLRQSCPLYKIIVADNGSNGENQSKIKQLAEANDRIEVLWLGENLGGAGGFERGMRYAAEKYNPDWYWIMDDDAYPKPDTLEKLLQHKDLDNLGCLAPLIWGVDWQQYQLYHHKKISRFHTVDAAKFANVDEMREIETIDADAFVGTLFPKRVVEDVGFPDGSMFIYGDDTEYTTRINQKYKIYLVKDAVIEHNDPPVANAVFSPKTFWKLYYTIRNKLLVARRYNRGFGKVIGVVLLSGGVLWQIGYSLVRSALGKYRFLRIKLVLMGFWHGVRGRGGKTVDPVEFMKQFDD